MFAVGIHHFLVPDIEDRRGLSLLSIPVFFLLPSSWVDTDTSHLET